METVEQNGRFTLFSSIPSYHGSNVKITIFENKVQIQILEFFEHK